MLGELLRSARDAADLSQQKVAEQAHISREYLSKIENGRASPTVDVLLRLCRAIGVRASRIVERLEK